MDIPRNPMGPRDLNAKGGTGGTPSDAAKEHAAHFRSALQQALSHGPLSQPAMQQLVDLFANSYRRAAQPSVRPDAARDAFASLQKAAQQEPAFGRLAMLAQLAQDTLAQGKPPRPLKPSDLAGIVQNAQFLMVPPHPADLGKSPSASGSVSAKSDVARSPGSPALARQSPVHVRGRGPREKRSFAATLKGPPVGGPPVDARGLADRQNGAQQLPPPDDALFPGQPLANAVPLNSRWSASTWSAAGSVHAERDEAIISPFVMPEAPQEAPPAYAPPGELPVEPGVTGLGIDFAGLKTPRSPRSRPPLPALDRPLVASDTLLSSGQTHVLGEGALVVEDANRKRFMVPDARYLRVDDPQLGDLHLVETKKLGGGSFGQFSVGLLRNRADETEVVAIKRLRTGAGNNDPDMIHQEFVTHQNIFSAINTHLSRKEEAFDEHALASLQALRTSYEPQRVHRAVYDDARKMGILVSTVADGDMLRVMTNLMGDDVSQDIRKTVAKSFVAQVGTQVGIMHDELQTLHLDIKAANVLFRGTGQMAMTDFGLSLPTEEAGRRIGLQRGSMPAPEMYPAFAPPGVPPEYYCRMTAKTDAFCLALSALEMLAPSPTHALAAWQQNHDGSPLSRDAAQTLHLQAITNYMSQMEGPPGQRRFTNGSLPNLGGHFVEQMLNRAAQTDRQLTEKLLSALEVDPDLRPTVQELARFAAESLPPARSRLTRQVVDFHETTGAALRGLQPRAALYRLAPAVPRSTRPLPRPPAG